jgi:hypothetical protein
MRRHVGRVGELVSILSGSQLEMKGLYHDVRPFDRKIKVIVMPKDEYHDLPDDATKRTLCNEIYDAIDCYYVQWRTTYRKSDNSPYDYILISLPLAGADYDKAAATAYRMNQSVNQFLIRHHDSFIRSGGIGSTNHQVRI